jgi:hypothetical protein
MNICGVPLIHATHCVFKANSGINSCGILLFCYRQEDRFYRAVHPLPFQVRQTPCLISETELSVRLTDFLINETESLTRAGFTQALPVTTSYYPKLIGSHPKLQPQ